MVRGSFREGRFKAEQIRDFAVVFFLSSSFYVVHSRFKDNVSDFSIKLKVGIFCRILNSPDEADFLSS